MNANSEHKKYLKKQKLSTIKVIFSQIIIHSKKPNDIKKIYDIKLTNKSTPIENRCAKEFAYYYDLIWKDIDHYE